MALPAGVRPFRRLPVWSGITAFVVLICALDSSFLAARFAYGQWLANGMMVAVFLAVVRGAPPRLRALMWWGLVVGTGGEIVFSLFIGMYEYRLGNVPVYIPFGHSLLYAAVFYFVREPRVHKHREVIARAMFAVSAAYAVVWLVWRGDVYGFTCTLLFFYLLWKHESSRMFFLAMYLLVAYLEQFGTRFECWYWPPSLLHKVDWLPSGNPPSGISVFYFGFDVGCLDLYARANKRLSARYHRLKARKEAREAAAGKLAAA